jgi:hypothetical protein
VFYVDVGYNSSDMNTIKQNLEIRGRKWKYV